MSQNANITTVIPIWAGSSSFATGSTPFGLFDTESRFQTDADKVAKFCATRLGYPIMDIELQPANFYACFEDAICEYSKQVNEFNIRDNMLGLQGAPTGSELTGRNLTVNHGRIIEISSEYGTEAGSGGGVSYRTGSIAVTESISRYNLDTLIRDVVHPNQDIEIKKILHYAPPASLRFYDPYLGNQQMLDAFGFGGFSTGVSFQLMPVYSDLLRIQAIEFNDQMRKSGYGFDLVNNELTLYPEPTKNFTLWIHYIVKQDRSDPLRNRAGTVSDFSNAKYSFIPYSNINDVGRKWIWDYTLAMAKEMLGYVRGKYSTIASPGGEISLNYADLITAAQQEKDKLIEHLRESLEETSRAKQMERKKNEAENLSFQLQKMPLKFYVF